MRLLSWLLCAAAAIVPVITSEEKSLDRPKRESSEKRIVCYYTNWSVYRPGTAKFSPQNINPYLCTHLIYAFGGLSKENALKPFDKYQDIEQGGYAKFNGLKTYNKNLKTLLAIGGWNEGSARFSPLVADAERRRELVKNTIKFLRQNHFDGLDLDWEYPSFRDGGKPRDRDNYATLVQEFREEFERESEKTGRPRLLLTMAVPAGIEYIDKGYDVPKLNKYLDWMNILSYDYHSAFEPAINHHSPLFSLEEDDEYNFDAQLNIDYTVQHYIKLGAERSKLVLGIPTYGRSYTLFNPDATDIGSPADGPGEQGEATREKGYLAYYEICERIKSGGWEVENPNPEAMGPFAYKDNQWVGYDDEDIARAKAKYVNENDLGGIMFWSIDNDDFRGKCHGKPYPLIEAAKEALLASSNELVPTRSGSSRSNSKKQEQETTTKTKARKTRLRTKPSTTTEASRTKSSGRTTTTPQPPTTPDPGSDFVCKDEGFYPHPRDCKKYFWCLDSGPSSLGIVAHQFTCPSGLVFNKISDSCDYARNVICKTKPESTTTTTTTTTSTTTARTTTARSRLVITASPPRTPSTTTTTTTEPPEEEEAEEDEEDPGTIKELINLIKKLGGVEQLEKQLNLQNSDEKDKIKSSLYNRVLQGRTANRYRGVNEENSTPRYTSVFRNRPVGPQGSSTEETSTSTRGSDKPRYVTIQRNRTTKKPIKAEEESEEEEETEEVEEPQQPKRKEETTRPFRVRRPTTEASTEKEYVVLKRTRPQNAEEEVSTSKYKNIVRARSTTEAPAEEEEEDEETEEEEEISEEDEKEVEEEREAEPAQKNKKYSSIIRDNKKVIPDEEEPKVSGPQGPRFESGDSSTTTESKFEGRVNVNNVNTVATPRYVEIRRTQPTSTESSGSDVNIVHIINDKEAQNEVSEEPEARDNSDNGFQRRITTEVVRRPTRPSFRVSTIEKTTPISVESTSNESQRFRGRFRSSTFTEPTATTETPKFNNRYRTINRNNDRPIITENELEQTPKRGFRSSTTTTTSTTTTENSFTNGVSRRFQFAPRTKPTILQPKPFESTTESFTITVPDLPDPNLTENILASSFPSATLEPVTTSAPFFVDSTLVDVTENDVTTFEEKKLPLSTRFSIPTTSTLTSIVTSITESSFTERKRISVPKKARFKSELFKYETLETTPEEIEETTRPFYRTSNYKTITRTTTPQVETTSEPIKRRFRSKPTTSTTTTEEPVREKKYVPKKTRTFKKISTETPEVTSSTTERSRFQPRNKPRQVEQNNALFLRFNNARRKKIFSKQEDEKKDEVDDLEVEQTATFFGEDIDNNDRYILGGGVKQTSETDYLNADVFFITVPTVEEEEKLSSGKTGEEPTNSLELKKIAVSPNQANNNTNTVPIRNRFITNNPNLRNLRTRTRPFEVTTERNTQSTRPVTRNNLNNGNFNFRNLRAKTQASLGKPESDRNNALQEADIKEPVSLENSSPKTPNFRNTRTRNFVSGDITNNKVEFSTEGGFGTKEPKRFAFTPNPNAKPFRTRNQVAKEETAPVEDLANGRQESTTEGGFGTKEPRRLSFTPNSSQRTFRPRNQQIPDEVVDSNHLEENKPQEQGNSNLRKFRGRFDLGSTTTEATVSSTPRNTNVRTFRGRTRFTTEGPTSPLDSPSFTKSTRTPTTFSSQSRFRSLQPRIEDSISESSFEVPNTRQAIFNNLVVTAPEEFPTETEDGLIAFNGVNVGSTLGTTPGDSTFGTKVGVLSGTTVSGSSSKADPTSTVSVQSSSIGSSTRSETLTTVGLSPGFTTKSSSTSGSTPGSTTRLSSTIGSSPGSTTRLGSTFGSTPGSTTRLRPVPTGTPNFGSTVSVGSDQTSSSIGSGSQTTSLNSSISSSTTRTTSSLTSANGYTRNSSRNTFSGLNPSTRAFNSKNKANEPTESSNLDSLTSNTINFNSVSQSFRNFRNKNRQSTNVPGADLENSQDRVANSIASNPNVKVIRTRIQSKVNGTEYSSSPLRGTQNESDNVGATAFQKDRRRVLVRARPVQQAPAAKELEEDNELEPPEETSSTTSKTTSSRKGTQEYFTNLRTRGRSTTQSPATNERTERTERRRVPVDRRRFRPETRSSTLKPEALTETTVSPVVRSNVLLRRRTRPTTSTTTSTTTTTEEPYIEQQEDSRLEESKSIDENPDIQDLADPAVVAIHNLATVSPGPIGPVVTASINPFSQTPATYTVHVTPADIASFTTPSRISSVTPGSVPPRPTSILTLKPYTVPVITKDYVAKQTPIPIRTPSPFRGTGVPVVTEEPYTPRGELVIQSRRPETTQRSRPSPAIASAVTQKGTTSKSRRLKPFSKVPKQEVVQSVSSPEPPVDYEYYDEDEDPLANIPASALKVKVHSDGYIECLDRGNFPHPFSCKKFISCAKMENNELLGWEYTCPKHLSFDPVGGICNWSAGLGCQH